MSDVTIPEDVKQRADEAWNELATTPATPTSHPKGTRNELERKAVTTSEPH